MAKRIDDIDDLLPDKTNANKGTQRGRGMVEASLRETGAGRSIVADKNGQVIAGNKTLEAWADIGGEIEVVRTDGKKLVVVQREDLDLSDDTGMARKLAYYDNRASEVGLEWDTEQLLADMNAGVDLLDFFRQDELDELFADLLPKSETTDAGAQVDRAEELRQKWGVETGQLWQLGDHRLICGDCTDADVVARVMQNDKAEMVWTDPPYGVKYGDKLDAANPMGYRVRSIQNDDLPPAELEVFIRKAFQRASDHAVAGAALYAACPAGTLLPTCIAAFVGSGFDFRWQLVWVKDSLVLSRADYHFRHENILYGWKPDGAHWFVDDRTQDSVFEVPRPKVSDEHPTMKPVELVVQMIRNSSKSGAVVYEPFSGSGTTIIACEQLGRKCRAIEISPAYVAVALDRWATATGNTPVLVE